MASIELPRRAYTATSSDGQAHEEPPPETRRRASARFLPRSKARKTWLSFFSRLPALKGLPFSPVLAPHCDVRDYSALERTYLAFIRTSDHLASAGVTIGQLFILHDDRRRLGQVLSAVLIGCAITTALLGAVEYFRQHHALMDTSVHQRRTTLNTMPNMVTMAGILLLVCGGLFVVILIVA